MKHLLEFNSENSIKINRIVYNPIQSLLILDFSRPLKCKPLITITLNDKFLTDIEWNSPNDINSNVWFTNSQSISKNQLKSLNIQPIPTFAKNDEYIEPIDISFDEKIDKQLYIWEKKTNDLDRRLGLEECYLKTLRELHKLEPNNKCLLI